MAKYLRQTALTLLPPAVCLLLQTEDKTNLHPFCPFHRLTGIPCPGCGGTRTAKLLLSLNFHEAFSTNPLSALFCISIPFLLALYWYDTLTGKNNLHQLSLCISKRKNTIPILTIILINWVYLIINKI